MTKINACLVACLLCSVLALNAAERSAPYLSANLGVGILLDGDISNSYSRFKAEYDPGLALALALGYRSVTDNLRGEFELAFQGNDVHNSSGTWSMGSLMANGYYDLPINGSVRPFLSLGAGGARLTDSRYTAVAFATQVGAGLAFQINPRLSFDVRYRYFVLPFDAKDEGIKVEYASSNIYGGLRLSLN